jgi:twitching motility protein PilT
MSFVPSLLQAIVRLDGEAVVLHVGEKPYVVTPTGQVDLASRGLTLDAVTGILNELLPIESQNALDEFGAAQYEIPVTPDLPGEHFTIVAARGGDDVWVEIRRRRVADDDRVPLEVFGSPATEPVQPEPVVQPLPVQPAAVRAPPVQPVPMKPAPVAPVLVAPAPAAPAPAAPVAAWQPPTPVASAPVPTVPHVVAKAAEPPKPLARAERDEDHEALEIPDVSQLFPGRAATQTWDEIDAAALTPAPALPPRPHPVPAPSAPRVEAPPAPVFTPPPPLPSVPAPRVFAPAAPKPLPPPAAIPAIPSPGAATVAPPAPPRAPTPVAHVPPMEAPLPPSPAVVLPLARNPIRADVPPPLGDQALSGLDRLLRLAAARGASILYLSSGSRPAVRVDGDVQTLDGAPVLGPNDVEALLLTLMPERSAEALRTGMASEWIYELADLGRIRCTIFRDHGGPGGVFRMMPTRAVSAEQLGLSREIQSLAIEPEGLVLVAGPRSSGKRTLISAFVDVINRARRDHVITVEREINVVHERSGSFISQREVRGSSDEMLSVARAALREDPDVIVLEEVRTPGLMNLALDAAASGQLVIGGFPAHSASGAIDRIIDLYPPEYRRHVQLSLAQNLRGVVAQVLLRKTGGGRVAAREVLLNTPAVRSVLAEGKTSQLPLAIEGGRVHGMAPLNDALVGYVQNGMVDVREASRRAADGAGFLALLKRQGLDTSAIERYA